MESQNKDLCENKRMFTETRMSRIVHMTIYNCTCD